MTIDGVETSLHTARIVTQIFEAMVRGRAYNVSELGMTPYIVLGAEVTAYGEGMVERVRAIAGGAPDLLLHTALVPGVLPDLIRMVDGDPKRVMSITDFDEEGLGVRTTGREPDLVPRYDSLKTYAQRAADGRFTIPVTKTFSFEEGRAALELSRSGHAHGKLMILPDHDSLRAHRGKRLAAFRAL